MTCGSDRVLSPDPARSVRSHDVSAPSVTITAPAPGTVISTAATIVADASDDILMGGVEFLLNGLSLGPEDDTAPYEFLLNPDTLAAGQVELSAIARDAAGNTTVSDVVAVIIFHPDTTPPTVAITAPEDGSTLIAPTVVSADANDDFLLAGVRFELNGIALDVEDVSSPWETQLNTDTLPDGDYQLTATARDTAGNTTVSSAVGITIFHPDVALPTVAITSPADGATLTAPTTVTADASDDGVVAGVLFKLNGIDLEPEDLAAPYEATLNTDTLPDGGYQLTATARDTAGNTAVSSAVGITIFHPDVAPPTVAITAPTSGATVIGVITITADAGDDTKLAGVQFKLNGSDLGAEDLVAPYAISLDTRTVVNGTISLTALARDTAGNTTLSLAVAAIIANPTPRNVVIVMVDDMRHDHLSHLPLTMGLLAPQSVQFSNAFASTPLCCPARATLLTGRYAHNHGVLSNGGLTGGAPKFNPVSTLATWLHNAGFRTGMIGKYMNMYELLTPVIPPGWDDFQVFAGANGTAYYNYTLNENGVHRSYGSTAQDYATTVLADRVVEFINSTPVSQPLMVIYSPPAPHAPGTPHPSDIGRYASFPRWRPPSYNELDVSDKTNLVKKTSRFSSSQMNSADQQHRRMLESLQSVDRGIVDIVNALQQQQRWDSTMLIFLSDNGLAWGEHRLLDRKSCPYEDCIRIPLVIRTPGIPARSEPAFTSNVDIAPTVAAWTGVTPGGPVNGLDLLTLMNNPGTAWRSDVLIEQLGLPQNYQNFYTVKDARYVYTEYLSGEKEFYDLQVDPHQMTNQVKNTSYASIISALRARLIFLRKS